MEQTLREAMIEKISGSLARKAVNNCGKWASKYRLIPDLVTKEIKPFSYIHHPWLWEMHNSKAEWNIGQKAAQMGFTEWGLNTTFYAIDILGLSVLYVLPGESDASDFTASRFDPALECSPYLRNLFSDVKNVGHKRAGQSNLFVRGCRSKAKLKSIPAALIVFDEVAEMEKENINLAMERSSGQMTKWKLLISTPTIFDTDINMFFNDSSQEYYTFQCPKCSRWTELTYPECFVVTGDKLNDPALKGSHLICKECKNKLDHETKPEWLRAKEFGGTGTFRATDPTNEKRGFSVSQLYSCTKPMLEIAEKIIQTSYDPMIEQEFYNSTLGVPHIVSGAQVDESMIIQCTGNFHKLDKSVRQPVTMGVDVGKKLHCWIDEWFLPDYPTPGLEINDEGICRTIWEGTVDEFEQLDLLMRQYSVSFCVVDRHPETRKAKEFANRFYGYVKLCMFGRGINARQMQVGSADELTVTVDRTSWMDLALVGRLKSKRIRLPSDLSEEAKVHLREPKRIYRVDFDGNKIGSYDSKKADHFALSRTYSEIALPFAASIGGNYTITI